jgi:hypothetical protein
MEVLLISSDFFSGYLILNEPNGCISVLACRFLRIMIL